ncbi:hypothetical protein H2201_000766 [Coniosporium apollinis]|uniref:Zn(2)-C6 fungal-type domain-containing protein n=1 Tax=Coniosporium apollinis TaxID=61459 RepID=A0ABQ9P2V2_9PEZI|nr:hypothetical protein H2201_000766 [Coniosporium apollinis]
MQSFVFAPPAMAPRVNQKNYVFVDEHNRHKRLKVMRACEGCRRRKIKCDAATTNSWPCAACIRLKLNCVPPTVSYEKDPAPGTHTFELDTTVYDDPGTGVVQDYQVAQESLHHMNEEFHPSISQVVEQSYGYHTTGYNDLPAHHNAIPYGNMALPSTSAPEMHYQSQPVYTGPPAHRSGSAATGDEAWRSDAHTASLTRAMGDLEIGHTAVAPYIMKERKGCSDDRPVEEHQVILPQHVNQDSTVHIPPGMMPNPEQAREYFDYFFTNIHPYAPVINPGWFLEQWENDRNSLSPLLLGAVFACSTLMLGESANGNQWLALTSRHEESYRDVPRLSTIQAMILLLKAREHQPKRGYFYRSWMTVVNCVIMAKDLELNEHFELHQSGGHCNFTLAECVTRTRVWQNLFILEIMIGGPQGRNDFGVDADTVDLDIPPHYPGQVRSEAQVSRQFTYLARIVKNIQETTQMHVKLKKKKKDWAIDPSFVRHNEDFTAWLRDLPQDLQIVYPDDGSSPWIPSHFIGNMHCYYHLSIIMHHRPQLHYLQENFDDKWKSHMLICYSSAKSMCKLQESILQTWGLPGLMCMQRGMSFTMYAVLTCTMLHLVAITAPEPELNADARDYFVRHMRILEECAPWWPLPELQAQVNALREAFSADIHKRFELKPSFPFGSPAVLNDPPPLNPDSMYRPRVSGHDPLLDTPGQVPSYAYPTTPPISATGTDQPADSPVVQSLGMMATSQRHPYQPSSVPVQEPVQWNPGKIFDQWNAAFGTPPPSSTSPCSPPLRPPAPGTYDLRTPQEMPHHGSYQSLGYSPHDKPVPHIPSQVSPPVTYTPQSASYVTPSMWQEVVASSFGDGLKRRWDYGGAGIMDQGQGAKRRG